MKRHYQPTTFKSAQKSRDVVADTYFLELFFGLNILVFDYTKNWWRF
tara:strand:+ start:464 stop:604 length:141 start_codon:yes stop_codon:yes gene_type:complete